MNIEVVQVKEVEPNVVSMEISVAEEELRKAWLEVCRGYSNRLNIPGFRRGHIPPEIVERFVGRDRVRKEAVDRAVARAYQEALRRTGVNPVERAKVEVVQEEPLRFKATVSVKPQVKLPEYKGLKAEKRVRKVTEKDIEREMEELRKREAKWVPVDEPATEGRLVRARVEVKPEGSEESHIETVQFVMGRARLVPDIASKVEGLKAGQSIEFDETYPEDFDDEELRGKRAQLKVEVLSVSKLELPPLDDDFARRQQFESLDDMREKIKEALEEEYKRQAEEEVAEELLKMVVEGAELNVPRPLVERTAELMLAEFKRLLERRGVKWEDYLRESNRTEEQVKEDFKGRAEEALRERFVVEAIAEAEGIEVTEEDLKERLGAGEEEEKDLNWDALRMLPEVRGMERRILKEKVVKLLIENARIEEREVVQEGGEGGDET